MRHPLARNSVRRHIWTEAFVRGFLAALPLIFFAKDCTYSADPSPPPLPACRFLSVICRIDLFFSRPAAVRSVMSNGAVALTASLNRAAAANKSSNAVAPAVVARSPVAPLVALPAANRNSGSPSSFQVPIHNAGRNAGAAGITGSSGAAFSAGVTGSVGIRAPTAAGVTGAFALSPLLPMESEAVPAAHADKAPLIAAATIEGKCLAPRDMYARPPMYPFARSAIGQAQWKYLNQHYVGDAGKEPLYPSGCSATGRASLSGAPNPPHCKVQADRGANSPIHYTPSGGLESDVAHLFPRQDAIACAKSVGAGPAAFVTSHFADAYPVAGQKVDSRAAAVDAGNKADLEALHKARSQMAAMVKSNADVAKPYSPQTSIVLEGTLIDVACYAQGGHQEPKQSCAAKCAHAGKPVGLLEGGVAGNPTYLLLASSQALAPHMNSSVRITGKVAGEDVASGSALTVDKLEKKNGNGSFEKVSL